MIYTYQIALGGSDYQNLELTHDVEMSGAWVDGTMIWREKIKELKINKALNRSIFDTLQTDFTDPTTFELKYHVKILKNSVLESLHWFGIKWGAIDLDLTSYVVEPELADLYFQYIVPYINDKESEVTPLYDSVIQVVNQGAANYPYLTHFSCNTLESFLKSKISALSGIAEADIVSSILWGDNYEDASTVTVTYGMLIDYVTNSYSVFKYACVFWNQKTWQEITIKDIFDLLAIWQIYAFFDSNDKLRFEYVSFFIHKLDANTIIIDTHPTEQIYVYSMPEIVTFEKMEMAELDPGDTIDEDWKELPITYSLVRNRTDLMEKTYLYSKYYTNLNFYRQNIATITSYFIVAAGFRNMVMNWANIDMDTFTANFHYLEFTGNQADACGSRDFKSFINDFTLTANITQITGALEASVFSRLGGLNSNVVTWSTTGAKSEAITIIDANVEDNYLKLQWANIGTFSFKGYLILQTTAGVHFINPWAVGSKSTTNIMNGHFSKANILNDYWSDYRLSRSGTMNGTLKTFNSTRYNLERKNVKQYFATIPNALHGIFDNNRIGRIESWDRNLETGFIELVLKYQEDNGAIYLTDEFGNLLTDGDGNPLIE